MPTDDGWDWPWLYYTATVLLNIRDSEFWRCSPRKLAELTKIHTEINNPEAGKESGAVRQPQPQRYIDQVML